MHSKVKKITSLVCIVTMMGACTLQPFGDSDSDGDSGPQNYPPRDLFNPEPAVTPSFINGAYCSGEFGDLPAIPLHRQGTADLLCDHPPTGDLRGVEFAALNIASLTAIGTGRNKESVTLSASYAALSPYFSHEVGGKNYSAALRSLMHLVLADEGPGGFVMPDRCWENDDRDRANEDCADRARAAHADRQRAFNIWSNLTLDERLLYVGISIVDWNKVAIHLGHYDAAYNQRRAEKRAKRRRIIGIIVGIGLTIATAGSGSSLGATFGAKLSAITTGVTPSLAAATVAYNAGVALGGMVVASGISAFTTLIVTGDFKASLKALTSVFAGKLEDAIIRYVSNLAGLNDAIVNAAVDAAKEGNIDGAVEAIGFELLGEHGHDFLQGMVNEKNGLNGFETYLTGLAKVMKENEDSSTLNGAMANFTATYMGGFISSYLHITSPRGLRLIENIVNHGIREGNFDAQALHKILVVEVKDTIDNVPDGLLKKLGGSDNASGVFSDKIAESLLEAPEDFDKAKEALKNYIDNLADKYNIDFELSDEASEEISKLFDHLDENGISQDSVEEYLSVHHVFDHLVTSYTPESIAQNGFLTAMDYATEKNLNRDQIEEALMVDVLEVVNDSAITSEIVHVFGGAENIIAEFQIAFASRLAYHRNRNRSRSTDELIELVLVDLENYGEKFADGFVGSYEASMINATLGEDIRFFLQQLTELYKAGNQKLAIRFFKDNLSISLAQAGIDLETFSDEEIMDIIQAGINIHLSRGTPPQMLDAMGSALSFYGRQDLCNFCN